MAREPTLKIFTYPKHVGDWRSGTMHMSAMEEGMYTRLCDQYFVDGGLNHDFDHCLKVCRATNAAEKRAVFAVLSEKFSWVAGRGYVHSGMDDRIAEIRKNSLANKEKAKAAAAARWGKTPKKSRANSNATSMRQALLEQCHPESIKDSKEFPY